MNQSITNKEIQKSMYSMYLCGSKKGNINKPNSIENGDTILKSRILQPAFYTDDIYEKNIEIPSTHHPGYVCVAECSHCLSCL